MVEFLRRVGAQQLEHLIGGVHGVVQLHTNAKLVRGNLLDEPAGLHLQRLHEVEAGHFARHRRTQHPRRSVGVAVQHHFVAHQVELPHLVGLRYSLPKFLLHFLAGQ